MVAVLAELEAILRGKTASKCESDILDFKQTKPNFMDTCIDLAEAAVCFANAEGGSIILGVADHGSGPDAFVGCALDASALSSQIHQLTNPHLLVEVRELRFAARRLLEVVVPEGRDVHSTTEGYICRRINTDCIPMQPLDITRLSEERRGIDWLATSSGRPIEDSDPLAIRYCRTLLTSSRDESRQQYADFNDDDLLSALKLVANDGQLSRAGELMLCREPTWMSDIVAVYQHKRTMGGEPDAIFRARAPLVLAFEEVSRAISSRQGITPLTLSNGQHLQIEDFPSIAVQEAMVNAFIHGDWRLRSPIQIEHSPQYLRITSSGPLVSGVTMKNILTRGSRARFPSLATSFRVLGLAEEVGQGIDRMYREMIRSGRSTPTITEDAEEVAVGFLAQPPRLPVTKFLLTLPPEEQKNTDALLIVWYLCEKRTVSAAIISEVIQRTVDQAQEVLRHLASDPISILEPTHSSMNRSYPIYRLRADVLTQLGNAVSYHHHATDQMDQKIIAHIADYGEINSRTIQRMFDVDVYQARDILRNLVSREIIVRSSTQKRGIAVKYSAGRSFPIKKRTGSRPRRRSDEGTGQSGDIQL